MTELNRILDEITGSPKWYAISENENEQAMLRNTAIRIRSGKVRPKTIENFLATFGYKVKIQVKTEVVFL